MTKLRITCSFLTLFSAILASKLLKEHLNLLGKVGCVVCIMGSTVVVIHSPKEQELQTMAELAEKLKDPSEYEPIRFESLCIAMVGGGGWGL